MKQISLSDFLNRDAKKEKVVQPGSREVPAHLQGQNVFNNLGLSIAALTGTTDIYDQVKVINPSFARKHPVKTLKILSLVTPATIDTPKRLLELQTCAQIAQDQLNSPHHAIHNPQNMNLERARNNLQNINKVSLGVSPVGLVKIDPAIK